MKIVAAYLLAVLGSNVSPSADDFKNILASVGAEANDDGIELLLSEVKGKYITELIAAGREQLASAPCGGDAAVAVAATGGAGSGAGAAPASAETKKEEKVEEKEESDDDMGFSLFDWGPGMLTYYVFSISKLFAVLIDTAGNELCSWILSIHWCCFVKMPILF